MKTITLPGLWLAGGLGVMQLAVVSDARASEAARTAAGDATSASAELNPGGPISDDANSDDPDEASVARRKPLGLMFDLGSMHGAMLSLAYRPIPWLRVHAGAGTNAVSPGYRAGVTVARSGGGPALNIEGGHFLPGDMNGLLKILVGTGYHASPQLEHFDYDFVNVHAGWEVESGNLIFFARGGVSLLWTTVPVLRRADADVNAASTPATEPFGLVLPSVAFGFIGLL